MTERERIDRIVLAAAREIARMWSPVGRAIKRSIGPSNRPPTPGAIARARAIAEAAVARLYGRSPLEVFTPDGRAQVGVGRALVKGIRAGARIPLSDAERLIRATLRGRPDVLDMLRGLSPPLPVDTARTWIDPRGHTLSDRIWQAGVNARTRIDATLDAGIAAGKSANQIADELLRFTQPASPTAMSDALRLARTEISRSHAQATLVASSRSPFVRAVRYDIDPSGHKGIDDCDGLVGVYAEIDSAPRPPQHPNCRCYLTPVLVQNGESTVAALERFANGSGPLPRTSIGWIDDDTLTTILTGFPPHE